MVYGAIDLHARYSQIRIVDEDGTVMRDQRVLTSGGAAGRRPSRGMGRCAFSSKPGRRASGWRRRSRPPGMTVIVADPNYAPMYGELRRKVKTDRRDVAALGEANRRGWYRATHRASAAQRACASCCGVVGYWCRCGRGTIALVRTLLRQDGYRLPLVGRRAGAARDWRPRAADLLAAHAGAAARG